MNITILGVRIIEVSDNRGCSVYLLDDSFTKISCGNSILCMLRVDTDRAAQS